MLASRVDTRSPYLKGIVMRTQVEQRSYTVSGMTCSHCVSAVQSEVSSVSGVQSVDVDLSSGSIKVTGQAFEDASVRAAVAKAGYDVT
jgi:copper chaperone CopZ